MGFDPSLSSPHPAGRARAAVAANGGSGIQPRTIDFCPNFFNCFFFFMEMRCILLLARGLT